MEAPTTENIIETHEREYSVSRISNNVLTNSETQFTSVTTQSVDYPEFKPYLWEKEIDHYLVRVKHLQTNGEIERSRES